MSPVSSARHWHASSADGAHLQHTPPHDPSSAHRESADCGDPMSGKVSSAGRTKDAHTLPETTATDEEHSGL
jgi:hypothetical protein